MLDFVGKRYWYYIASWGTILILIVLLGVMGLNWGIEFTSGSTLTLRFQEKVEVTQLRAALAEQGHGDAIIQPTEGDFFIRTRPLSEEAKDTLVKGLGAKLGKTTVRDFASVSPLVARGIVRNAILAVAIASIAILLYISWAFRKVPNPLRYGTCAVIALAHDMLFVLGAFTLLGRLFQMEINAMFITALLTVAGYSVHDTIVVFDRIRENLKRGLTVPLEVTINGSIMQTLGRSLTTSLTTLFVLTALYLLGGATIKGFVLTLILGIIVGTYSSIFVASQLLVSWERGEFLKAFRLLPFLRGRLARG